MIAEPKLVEAACGGDATAVEKLLVVCRTCAGLRGGRARPARMPKTPSRSPCGSFIARDKLQALDETLEAVLRQEPLSLALRKDLVTAITTLPDPYWKS